MNTENVSWSSTKENLEKEDLQREKTLTLFLGKINIEVEFLSSITHTHSFEITQILKTLTYTKSKIKKEYFNKIALMECEYREKWIGTVTYQRMVEVLENDIIRKFCNGKC